MGSETLSDIGGDIMQKLQQRRMEELVVLEVNETFTIPDNCFAFIEEADGRRRMIIETSVKGSEVSRLILTPRIAGG